MKKIPYTIAIFLLLFSLKAEAALDGWSYKAQVTITNSTATALVDYQVLLTLNTQSLVSAGKMQSDCDDMRFLDSDDQTQLSYWIESGANTASTKVWVKVPSIPASTTKTIYFYYGNATATAASSGTSTFVYFDDFDTYTGWSGDTSEFAITSVSGENVLYVKATATKYPGWIYRSISSITQPDGYAVHFKMKDNSATNNNPHPGGIFASTASNTWSGMYFRSASNQIVAASVTSGTASFGTPVQTQTIGANWHDVEARVNTKGTLQKLLIDDTVKTSFNDWAIKNNLTGVGFFHFAGSDGPGYYDKLRVRKYISTEPTVQVAFPIEKLSFITSEQTIFEDRVSAIITVQAQDYSGNGQNVLSNTTVMLSSTSPTGAFSLASTPFSVISYVTIPAGSKSASFYYRDSAAGTYTLTAYESPSQSWTDATQSILVKAVEIVGGYKVPVTITNSTATALVDYQVLLTLNTQSLVSAGKMQSDCDDMRFLDSDDQTQLSYWIESGANTASTKVWVKVPSIPASTTKTIYFYYGNATATAASSGTSTFVYFDDFDTYTGWSGDTSEFAITSVSGENVLYVKATATKYPGWIYRSISSITQPDGYAVHFKMKDNSATNNNPHPGGIFASTASNTWSGMYFRSASNQIVAASVTSGTASFGTPVQTQTIGANWHDVEARVNTKGTLQKLLIDDTVKTSFNDWAIKNNLTGVGFFHFAGSDGPGYYDKLRVRKYISTEPTNSQGSEETSIYKLVFTTVEQTIVQDEVSSTLRIQAQDINGALKTVASDVVIQLLSSSSDGRFSEDPLAWIEIDEITLEAGQSEVEFYYKDSNVGTPTIKASEYPSLGWLDATQDINILPKTTGFIIEATTPQIAGSPFAMTITAKDSDGNTVISYTGTVNLTVNYISPNTGAGVLSITSTSDFVNGIATITNQTFSDCGTITIKATDSTDATKTGTSEGIVFVPYDFTAAFSNLDYTSAHTVLKPFSLIVTARNASADTTPNYKGTSTLEITYINPSVSQSGLLTPTTLTSSNFSNGVAAVDTTYNRWGSIKIICKDSTLSTQKGTSSELMFLPLSFKIILKDPPVQRDFYYLYEDFDVTIDAIDYNEDTIPNYKGTIDFDGDHLNLPPDYTYEDSDAGSHVFSMNGNLETKTTFTVNDIDYTHIQKESNAITIIKGIIKVISASGPVGEIPVTVKIVKSTGELITSDNSTTFTITIDEFLSDNGSAKSDATTNPVTVSSGAATIYIEDSEAETITVTAHSKPSLEESSGTVRFGTISGSGVNIDMWRETER